MSEEKIFRSICIWCNAPWSDENILFENAYMSGGCDTCGYGASGSVTLVITCHSCQKEIYRKDGNLEN